MIYKKYDKLHKALQFEVNKRKEYRAKCIEIENAFKKALFEKHNVTNNDKAELCYRIAYDFGHSSGFSEVELYFDDLVELIK